MSTPRSTWRRFGLKRSEAPSRAAYRYEAPLARAAYQREAELASRVSLYKAARENTTGRS
jgi:hypothetical protein